MNGPLMPLNGTLDRDGTGREISKPRSVCVPGLAADARNLVMRCPNLLALPALHIMIPASLQSAGHG